LLTSCHTSRVDRYDQDRDVLTLVRWIRKREDVWALPDTSNRRRSWSVATQLGPVLEVGGRENSDEVRFGDNDAHPPVSFTSIFGLEPFDVRVSKIREGEIKDRSSLVVFGESSSVVGRVSE